MKDLGFTNWLKTLNFTQLLEPTASWGGWPGWAKLEVRHKNQRGRNSFPSPRGNETSAVRKHVAAVELDSGLEHVQAKSSCKEKDGVSAFLQ